LIHGRYSRATSDHADFFYHAFSVVHYAFWAWKLVLLAVAVNVSGVSYLVS
jgi:hypothetical protein